MFSLRSGVELGKAFAQVPAGGARRGAVPASEVRELIGLGAEPLHAALAHAATLGGDALLAFSGALVLIAAVDVPWQLWQYKQSLRMSRQEIREELQGRTRARPR